MKLQFPYKGLHRGNANSEQPIGTSPVLQNVRPFDISEGRIRGGQRPGLEKAYTTQVGGANPVIVITTVATTYIEPE